MNLTLLQWQMNSLVVVTTERICLDHFKLYTFVVNIFQCILYYALKIHYIMLCIETPSKIKVTR